MKHTQGWVLSNNEHGATVIQRDDESDRFEDDNIATEFVVKSYGELLEACKDILNFLRHDGVPNWDKRNQLQQVIAKAEGRD